MILVVTLYRIILSCKVTARSVQHNEQKNEKVRAADQHNECVPLTFSKKFLEVFNMTNEFLRRSQLKKKCPTV